MVTEILSGARREGQVVVLLTRHGRTAWNHERRFMGKSDIPLDGVGREQAVALAATVRPWPLRAVFTSPLMRALETARAVHPNPTVVDDLREMDQGELEGLGVREAFAKFPTFFQAWTDDPTDVLPPGGEALGACRDRVSAALDAIAERYEPGDVVMVVSHQLALASVSTTWSGEALASWRKFGLLHAEPRPALWCDGNWSLPAS